MPSSPHVDLDIKSARVTREKIVIRIRGNALKRRSVFVADPAAGALVVHPDFEHEIACAFEGELRRFKLRLRPKLLSPLFREDLPPMSGDHAAISQLHRTPFVVVGRPRTPSHSPYFLAGLVLTTFLNARSNSFSSLVTSAFLAASLNRLICSAGVSSGSLRFGMPPV
jgi:hypothetical protein